MDREVFEAIAAASWQHQQGGAADWRMAERGQRWDWRLMTWYVLSAAGVAMPFPPEDVPEW